MKFSLFALLLLPTLAAPALVHAQDDAEGCKDSALLTRMQGCHIAYCSKMDFDSANLQFSLNADPRTKPVEGKIEKIHYTCDGKSGLQVRRNAEQALRGAGFALDFSGYDVPTHYVTAHKGAQWVAVEAGELSDGCTYDLITVLATGMQQEMTTDAKAWIDQINQSGHASVYGIEFDTGKADIKPASEKVLGDVLAVLQAQPDWRMRIEGHTDSTGTEAGNMTLSQKRAESVVGWLVGKGIPQARLTAAGLGDTKPIADNAGDAGRARNRRVELVKQ